MPLGLVGAAAALLLLVDDALLGAAELTEVSTAALLVDAVVVGTAEVAEVLMATALDDEEAAGTDSRVLLWDAEARAEVDTALDSVAAGFSAEASVVGLASPEVVGIGVTVNEFVMEAAVVTAVELEPSADGRTMTQRASAPARSSAPRTEDETRILRLGPEDGLSKQKRQD